MLHIKISRFFFISKIWLHYQKDGILPGAGANAKPRLSFGSWGSSNALTAEAFEYRIGYAKHAAGMTEKQ